MSHFLVTGGAGFIGSHLVELLLLKGHRVTVVDDLSSGRYENLSSSENSTFIKKNVMACQPDDFPERIDGVAHLAATPSVVSSWKNALESHHNNLSATVTVLEMCRDLAIPRFAFASSAAVYGDSQVPPIKERDESPVSPYGLQKLTSERYGELFAKHLGISFIALRLFNVFGPRQRPDSQYSGVISLFTHAMKEGLPVTVFGDGSQTRDFIYVHDVAAAFAAALEQPLAPGGYWHCNVGTGIATSVLELLAALRLQYPDWNGGVRSASLRLGEIMQSVADVSTAKRLLGLKATWSLDAALKTLRA